jgi:N-acetylglutamate synthase-like GNAT family acetyltransferase
MYLRPIKPSDAHALMALKLSSIIQCLSHYTQDEIDNWIHYLENQNANDVFANANGFIIKNQSDIMGFINYEINDDILFINNLFVASAQARQGIGTRLLKEIDALAQDNDIKKIRVRATVNAADFYKRHDFIFREETLSRVNFKIEILEKSIS